jgi:hypothetical protein
MKVKKKPRTFISLFFASISFYCIFCFEAEAGTEAGTEAVTEAGTEAGTEDGTTASPSEVTSMCSNHGLINYIDTKEKCRHLKKIDL